MADGDAAAALGMDTVAGTEDKRDGWKGINRAMDYLAAHLTAGTHPASSITSGTLPVVRGGTGGATAAAARAALGIVASNISTTASSVQGDLDYIAGLAVDVQNGLLSPAVYSRTLSTAYRSLSVRSDGVLGYVASSRRFKQDIRSAEFSPEQLRGIRVVSYRYREAVKLHGDDAALEIGLIAEEVDALGLSWLVDYDEKGRPFGVLYDRLALAVLALAQAQQQQLDALAARLDKLEAGN